MNSKSVFKLTCLTFLILCISQSVVAMGKEAYGSSNINHINLTNDKGQTPLHMQCYGECKDATAVLDQIDKLIKNGVDVNAEDTWGQTALCYACHYRYPFDVIKKLIDSGSSVNQGNRKPLHVLAIHTITPPDVKVLREFLQFKPDINGLWEGDCTASHFAAQSNDVEIIRALIEHGACINIKDRQNGRTPLHYAIECKKNATVQELIKNKADVNCRDNSSCTPLCIAVDTLNDRNSNEMIKIVEELIEAGANDVRDSVGASLVYAAREKGNLAIADLISQVGQAGIEK